MKIYKNFLLLIVYGKFEGKKKIKLLKNRLFPTFLYFYLDKHLIVWLVRWDWKCIPWYDMQLDGNKDIISEIIHYVVDLYLIKGIIYHIPLNEKYFLFWYLFKINFILHLFPLFFPIFPNNQTLKKKNKKNQPINILIFQITCISKAPDNILAFFSELFIFRFFFLGKMSCQTYFLITFQFSCAKYLSFFFFSQIKQKTVLITRQLTSFSKLNNLGLKFT